MQGFLASNLTQTSGEIMLDNEVINPRYYRSLAFASIMQNPRTCFNPLLSIHYHLKETLQALHKPYDKSFILQCLQESGFNTQASHTQTKSYAQYVLDSYPFELSGGMLQRVMIALALLTQAPFIIADEPTSDLNRDVAFEILETLHTLQMQKKIGILLITHDLEVVANMAQYVYVVDKGKIVEDMALDKDFYLYTPTQNNVLKHISLELNEGESLAIMGKSGCGKSTLAQIACGLLSPTLDELGHRGEVYFNNQPLKLSSIHQRRLFYTQVQILFQDSIGSLNPRLSCLENLIEPLIYLRGTTYKENLKHIESLLETFRKKCSNDFRR